MTLTINNIRKLGYSNIAAMQKFRKEYNLLKPHQGTTLTLTNNDLLKNDFEQGIEEISKTMKKNNELWWFKPIINKIMKLRNNAQGFNNETIILNVHNNNNLDYTVNFEYRLSDNKCNKHSLSKRGIIFVNSRKK